MHSGPDPLATPGSRDLHPCLPRSPPPQSCAINSPGPDPSAMRATCWSAGRGVRFRDCGRSRGRSQAQIGPQAGVRIERRFPGAGCGVGARSACKPGARGSRVSANRSGLKGFGGNGVRRRENKKKNKKRASRLLWCFVRPEPDFVFIHNHPPTVWVASLEPSGLRAPSARGHPRPRVLLSDPSPAAPNKSPFAFPCRSPWVQSRGRGGGRAGAADHLVAAHLRYPTRRPGRAPTNPRPKVVT